jgi:hypothetical protein
MEARELVDKLRMIADALEASANHPTQPNGAHLSFDYMAQYGGDYGGDFLGTSMVVTMILPNIEEKCWPGYLELAGIIRKGE